MKKLHYIAAFALGLATVSCDVLDKEPSNSWESSTAIQSYDDLVYAVNGVYESQTNAIDNGSNYRGSYAGDFTLYADMKGSDYQCLGNNNQATDVSRYQATPSGSVSADNFYKRFYLSIARINKVLEGVKEAGLEGDDINTQLGELYALRALFHFDLARLFAKLPSTVDNWETEPGIVLSLETHDSDYIGTRSSLKTTYETIISDLGTALNYLQSATAANNGHINYWGALALRARVYLYMDNCGGTDYNSLALQDAEDVINSGVYSLYERDDYAGAWSSEYTSESILEIQVTSLYNPQRNSLGYYTHAEGYAEAALSTSFQTFLNGHSGDIRSTVVATEQDGNISGTFSQKYPGRNGEIYVNNPKVIRLSEMYLIAAEAALKANSGNAVSYINQLREKRIANYSDVSNVTLDEILDERRLELNGEGHMAWDMWRNKKSVNNPYAGEITYDDYRTVLPIPQAEINVSKGSLKQNQGY